MIAITFSFLGFQGLGATWSDSIVWTRYFKICIGMKFSVICHLRIMFNDTPVLSKATELDLRQRLNVYKQMKTVFISFFCVEKMKISISKYFFRYD